MFVSKNNNDERVRMIYRPRTMLQLWHLLEGGNAHQFELPAKLKPKYCHLLFTNRNSDLEWGVLVV